ncbi:MAG TPA: hypothetical protein VFR37_06390, partial [Longimicrobium sp.]|nr:hypothetical protein [Longimicrobium sp.]
RAGRYGRGWNRSPSVMRAIYRPSPFRFHPPRRYFRIHPAAIASRAAHGSSRIRERNLTQSQQGEAGFPLLFPASFAGAPHSAVEKTLLTLLTLREAHRSRYANGVARILFQTL